MILILFCITETVCSDALQAIVQYAKRQANKYLRSLYKISFEFDLAGCLEYFYVI